MRKGDIYRRETKSGIQVGDYLRILKGGADYNTAGYLRIRENLFEDEEQRYKDITVVRKTDHLHKVFIMKVVVPEFIFDRCVKGYQDSIIHDATAKWESLLHKEPELIQLSSVTYAQKRAIFKVEGVATVFHDRVRRIRLVLGARIE